MHLLRDPLPCAHPDCGQTAAAHIGFMLGHQYEEPQPERQGLERASGYPRMVDGPGCTPAAVCGAQAQDSDGTPLHCNKAPDHLTKNDPWHNMVSAAALAGRQAADRVLRSTDEEFEQARDNGRAFRARLGTPRVMHITSDGQPQPVEPDPLAAVRPAEVRPATPAEATADRCDKCRRPFDQSDPSFEGLARHSNTPFCRECITLCHDSEIADHWCAVDEWRRQNR